MVTGHVLSIHFVPRPKAILGKLYCSDQFPPVGHPKWVVKSKGILPKCPEKKSSVELRVKIVKAQQFFPGKGHTVLAHINHIRNCAIDLLYILSFAHRFFPMFNGFILKRSFIAFSNLEIERLWWQKFFDEAWLHSLKLTQQKPLKMDGWNTRTFPFRGVGWPIFREGKC